MNSENNVILFRKDKLSPVRKGTGAVYIVLLLKPKKYYKWSKYFREAEIPHLSCNPQFSTVFTGDCPLLVPSLREMNHSASHSISIRRVLILCSNYAKYSSRLKCSDQHFHVIFSTMRPAWRLSHPPWFDDLHSILWTVQIMEFLIM
jgi:hypothetical protein